MFVFYLFFKFNFIVQDNSQKFNYRATKSVLSVLIWLKVFLLGFLFGWLGGFFACYVKVTSFTKSLRLI